MRASALSPEELRAALARQDIAWGWLLLYLGCGMVMLIALGLLLSAAVLNMARYGSFLAEGVAGIVAALEARWPGRRIAAGAQALDGLLVELDARGFIPDAQVAEALGCAAVEELPARLRTLDERRATYVPGLGLCSRTFADEMRKGLRRKRRSRAA